MINTTNTMPLCRTNLFGLDIVAASFTQAHQHLLGVATSRHYHPQIAVTPNIDHIVRLDAAQDFKMQYAHADFIFADGMPVVWASRMAAVRLPERVTGSDLFVSLARDAVRESLRVFVLGGMPGQEQFLQELFAQYYPGLHIDILCPSMQFDPAGEEGAAAVEQVNRFKPDILFVCLGMPKQETWAFLYKDQLQASLVMCVGAAMEFALHLKKRAPDWMQRMGLEWFWRLCDDPGRLWHRYLVRGARFIPLCMHEWQQQRLMRKEKNKNE